MTNGNRWVGVDLHRRRSQITIIDEHGDSAVGSSSLADRAPVRRIQASGGRAPPAASIPATSNRRCVPILNGLDVPLILAATEPLDSIFRSVNSYPRLGTTSIAGNPERTSDAELAASARGILDALFAEELGQTRERFERRLAEGRALLDIGDVARAATQGAIDTVLVDIDAVLPGSIDEQRGTVTLSSTAGAVRYGVVDEIARRAWLAGGTCSPSAETTSPGRGPVAAILRCPI